MKFEELEARAIKTAAHIPLILRLDETGSPRRWMGWQEAVTLHWNGKVSWEIGDPIVLHGGTSARTGLDSIFELKPILAIKDQAHRSKRTEPLLSNRILFKRDQYLCLYCGHEYPANKLTRDHIIPRSRGGKDIWSNVATACKGCNHRKADRTLDECKMDLLAVPYTPSRSMHMILSNRRIIADQMDYLKKTVTTYELTRLK